MVHLKGQKNVLHHVCNAAGKKEGDKTDTRPDIL